MFLYCTLYFYTLFLTDTRGQLSATGTFQCLKFILFFSDKIVIGVLIKLNDLAIQFTNVNNHVNIFSK